MTTIVTTVNLWARLLTLYAMNADHGIRTPDLLFRSPIGLVLESSDLRSLCARIAQSLSAQKSNRKNKKSLLNQELAAVHLCKLSSLLAACCGKNMILILFSFLATLVEPKWISSKDLADSSMVL